LSDTKELQVKHFLISRYRGDSTNVASRDYQGAAAAEAKVEAEAAAGERRWKWPPS